MMKPGIREAVLLRRECGQPGSPEADMVGSNVLGVRWTIIEWVRRRVLFPLGAKNSKSNIKDKNTSMTVGKGKVSRQASNAIVWYASLILFILMMGSDRGREASRPGLEMSLRRLA